MMMSQYCLYCEHHLISLFIVLGFPSFRDDQFGSDLLPEEVPVLLDQLPEDDRQNIEE